VHPFADPHILTVVIVFRGRGRNVVFLQVCIRSVGESPRFFHPEFVEGGEGWVDHVKVTGIFPFEGIVVFCGSILDEFESPF